MDSKSYAGRPIVLTKKQIDELTELSKGFWTEASPSAIQTIKNLNAALVTQITECYQEHNIDEQSLMFVTVSPVLSFTSNVPDE